jgi:hypothetical protein
VARTKHNTNLTEQANMSSSETRQQIEDLFAMGFIQESEYRLRLAAIGVNSASSSSASAPRQVATSRERLIASFDSFANANSLVNCGARTPFLRLKDASDSDVVQCHRCGAPEVPRSSLDSDHRFVCHQDSTPHSLLEFPCPLAYLGCSATVSSRTWSSHISRECNYAAVVCRGVVQFYAYEQLYARKVIWGDFVCAEEHLREPLLAHLDAVHTRIMSQSGDDLRSPALHSAVCCPVAHCNAKMPLAEMASHLLKCPQYKVTGSFRTSHCGQKIAQMPGVDATRSEFDQRTVDRVSARDYWEEFNAESDDEQLAENSEGVVLEEIPGMRKDYLQVMTDHFVSRGEPAGGHVQARMLCPLCGRRVGRNRFGRHLANCPQYTVSCPKCYEDVGQRANIVSHVCASTPAHAHAKALIAEFNASPHKAKWLENSAKPEPPVQEYVMPSSLPENSWY